MSLHGARNMRFVDSRTGEISREIFVSKDIYQEEQAKVFSRAWLFIGHESQVPQPGNFVLSRMGEESVILTRDHADNVQVLLNSCRHRGMRVCRYDEGKTEKFFCPYHGWSYNLDGALAHVAHEKTEYSQSTMDRADWGLIKPAKVAVLRGLVWATWDPNAPSFDEYLGGARHMLDLGFRAWDGEGEVEVLGSTQKWLIPSNWKIVAENFAGDMLHVVSHRSVDIVGIGPTEGEGRRDPKREDSLHVQVGYPEGHAGVITLYSPEDPRRDYGASKVTAEYFQDCLAKRRRLLGKDAEIVTGVGTIYPNTSFHTNQPRTVLAAHPVAADRTEMWRLYFVDKNAPKEVKQFLRRYYIRYSGPAGLTEQDDMENWNYATSASEGVIARKYVYNYMAGLNQEKPHPSLPDGLCAVEANSESNARAFYNRWQEYMDRT